MFASTVFRYQQTCHASVNLVYDRNRRRYAEDKLSKNHFDPLFGDPLRHRHQKGRNHIRDRALPSCKISRRSVASPPRYVKTLKLQHIWSFGGTTGATGTYCTFLESCFHGKHLYASVLNLYSKASKLAMLKKCAKMQHTYFSL